jgi:hypothetical protein
MFEGNARCPGWAQGLTSNVGNSTPPPAFTSLRVTLSSSGTVCAPALLSAKPWIPDRRADRHQSRTCRASEAARTAVASAWLRAACSEGGGDRRA